MASSSSDYLIFMQIMIEDNRERNQHKVSVFPIPGSYHEACHNPAYPLFKLAFLFEGTAPICWSPEIVDLK